MKFHSLQKRKFAKQPTQRVGFIFELKRWWDSAKRKTILNIISWCVIKYHLTLSHVCVSVWILSIALQMALNLQFTRAHFTRFYNDYCDFFFLFIYFFTLFLHVILGRILHNLIYDFLALFGWQKLLNKFRIYVFVYLRILLFKYFVYRFCWMHTHPIHTWINPL